jgi:hypothetical protein
VSLVTLTNGYGHGRPVEQARRLPVPRSAPCDRDELTEAASACIAAISQIFRPAEHDHSVEKVAAPPCEGPPVQSDQRRGAVSVALGHGFIIRVCRRLVIERVPAGLAVRRTALGGVHRLVAMQGGLGLRR